MMALNETASKQEVLAPGTVLIAGGGPVGLLLATVLSHYGVKSVICERNKTTTKWPKMDLTNGRSMEMLRRLGLADALRERGVPSHIPQPVLFSSGLSQETPFTKWALPSVDQFRQMIIEKNDGSMPREAWQRVSQVIFERWLKGVCDTNPDVDVRFGVAVETVEETGDGVTAVTRDVDSGERTTIKVDYMAGCDGASSKTRQSLSMPLDGGPMPVCVLLVHFKSRDLTRLHKQGQFWHIFFVREPGIFSGAIIAQDEIDTWTTHLFLPMDADPTEIESKDAVAIVLGGLNDKYPVAIDEILVRSVWRPNIAVARQWSSRHGRVHIAGDAAHQNIPTGGYGMNMGVGDAYDLGWKLAAVCNGYAGPGLLESYEAERRAVSLRNTERSGQHMKVHEKISEILMRGDPHRVDADNDEGRDLREELHKYYQENDHENKDFGIEMGYRYQSNCVVPPEANEVEPELVSSHYTPTTWPGSRPPHLFLDDGSAIFDLLGKHWTLVTFSDSNNNGSTYVMKAAENLKIPIKHLDLKGQEKARKLWEKEIVLVRPDEHVAWRTNSVASIEEAADKLQVVVGLKQGEGSKFQVNTASAALETAFTSTTSITTQTDRFELDRMADFQK